MGKVADEMRRRLEAALGPSLLEIEDQSARHAGHAGARAEGESHFHLVIVAKGFAGRTRVARQRMVYAAVGDLMQSDIHALSMVALTPEEAAAGPR